MQAIQSLSRIATVAAVAIALTACVAYPQGTYQNSYPMPQGGYQGSVYQGGHSGTGFPGAANATYPTTSYPVGSYPAQTYPNNNCGLNRNGSGYGDNYGQQNGYDNNCYQYNNVQQARVLNIETVRVQDSSGIGAGGAIAGGVIGGVLGNQVGKGSGRTLATIAGVVGGALAGNAVQNSVGGGSVRDIYRVTVQMRDGSVRAFDYQQPRSSISASMCVWTAIRSTASKQACSMQKGLHAGVPFCWPKTGAHQVRGSEQRPPCGKVAFPGEGAQRLRGLMNRFIARSQGLDAEKACTGSAAAHFLFRGFAHGRDLQMQTNGNAGQRVIAVQHHMLGIDLGDGVEQIGRHGVGALGHGAGLEGHAFLYLFGEQLALFQKDQVFVVVAESLFRLQVQVQFIADHMALQGFLDALEQVVAADEELNRLVQHVQLFAQGVFQCPGQSDHALLGNFHGVCMQLVGCGPVPQQTLKRRHGRGAMTGIVPRTAWHCRAGVLLHTAKRDCLNFTFALLQAPILTTSSVQVISGLKGKHHDPSRTTTAARPVRQADADPGPAKDAQADAELRHGLSAAPDATYWLAQRTLMLEQAMQQAQQQISELQQRVQQLQQGQDLASRARAAFFRAASIRTLAARRILMRKALPSLPMLLRLRLSHPSHPAGVTVSLAAELRRAHRKPMPRQQRCNGRRRQLSGQCRRCGSRCGGGMFLFNGLENLMGNHHAGANGLFGGGDSQAAQSASQNLHNSAGDTSSLANDAGLGSIDSAASGSWDDGGGFFDDDFA